MTLIFYGHPFSSYCQKVQVALYENVIPFEYRIVGPDDPQVAAEWASLWPLRKFPVISDEGEMVAESTIIIEHLQLKHPGPVRLIPGDPSQALQVRFMDRFFDNHVMAPATAPVLEVARADGSRKDQVLAKAAEELTVAYGWLEERLAGRTWAAGKEFSLADCAAAPSLFYADWVHPIGDEFANVRAYRSRLLQRPSFARAVNEGRPYRSFFPLGAPDRD